MSNEPRRFFDASQPQTLQGAVMLCYITAAFGLISLLLGLGLGLVPLLLAVGGYGVANEKRWGYWLAAVLAVLNLLTVLWLVFVGFSFSFVLSLLFAAVLVGLLLHPQSRHYERIWFK
ncbi:MAG TPA: hypothetical protein VEJ21_05190 [Acidimicrobiales bacterium]|nr:hypothetical protein [Acidimicrobiales bacterium]HXW32469.1 hypothetical protein [Acidimicrobiales bacterium]